MVFNLQPIGDDTMRGGNCQTCKHFLKIDEYPGGHYIGICQGQRLGVKVDGLSICEGFQLDSDKRNALKRDHPRIQRVSLPSRIDNKSPRQS